MASNQRLPGIQRNRKRWTIIRIIPWKWPKTGTDVRIRRQGNQNSFYNCTTHVKKSYVEI